MNFVGGGVFVLLLIFVAGFFGLFGQTAFGGGDTDQLEDVAAALATGKIATVKTTTVDIAGDSPSQVASTAYFWNVDTPKILKGGRAGLTTSSSTTANIKSVVVGETLKGVAFDSIYYGLEKSQKITKESDQMDLQVLKIVDSSMEFIIKEDGTTESSPSIDVTGTEEDAFTSMTLSQSNAGEAFNLKEICFQSNESTSSTNISFIKIEGLSSPASTESRKAQQYCAELPEAQMIRQFAEYISPTVRIKGSTGCAGHEELITVTWIDQQHYVSNDNTIKTGTQNDASPPADIGETDAAQVDTFVCS